MINRSLSSLKKKVHRQLKAGVLDLKESVSVTTAV